MTSLHRIANERGLATPSEADVRDAIAECLAT
jgi:hypothetical protein